ncbi:MAG: hypothetical protein R8G01_00290 [Ilumatobacteraceae bacterium]|nr:hypothetical protein [Ilumatobacteraceae bacterium]
MMSRRRLARLGAIALLVGAVAGASVGHGAVVACSCSIPDLAADLERARIIVSGQTVDFREEIVDETQIGRRWLVEVDERYRGETPDVLEVVLDTELHSCSDTRVSLPQVMLLVRRNDGAYELPECISTPTESDLVPFFDEPWPATADGPPVAIGKATTGDHDLALVDDAGGVVGYLPGVGRTIGLSNCPGDTHFVQLRTPTRLTRSLDPRTAVELVRWRYGEAAPAEVIEIDATITQYLDGGAGIPVNCRGADGNDVGIEAEAVLAGKRVTGIEYVGGSFAASEDVFDQVTAFGRVIVLGPGDLAFVPSDGVIRPPLVDGDNESGPAIAVELPDGVPEFTGWENYQSVRPTPAGWEVTVREYGDHVDTFFVVDVTVDGEATLVDRAVGTASARGPAIVIASSIRRGLTDLGSTSAAPLFDRSGERIELPAPTLPPVVETAATTVERTPTPAQTADAVTDDATPVADADGEAPWARWATAALLVLVVLGAVGFVVRRRATR